MSANKRFGILKDKYFVVLMADEPPTGYKVKVATVYIGHDGKIRRTGNPSRWVNQEDLKVLDPAVVDIMVASHAI